MLRIIEGDYAYASARVRAKEPRLLRNGHFDRMLDAPSPGDAIKVLTEAEYGFGGDSRANISAFENLLDDELKKNYMFLLEIAPQPEIIWAFQRKHDFFNLKVLLKAELSGQDAPPILADTGTIGKEAMRRMVRERDYSEFTPVMREALETVYDAFARLQDPQVIDLLLDRASYHQFVSDLARIDSGFLHEIAEMTVDMANIRMFVRARSLNKGWDFIKRLLFGDGTIPEEFYAANADKPVGTFVEQLGATRYGAAVRKGREQSAGKGIADMERLLDDQLMEHVRGAKHVTIGVEPVIAWLFAKETEIRNVRIIMTGRINGLPVEKIRERLRAGYV